MDKLENQMIDIVNRNHERRIIMDRIDQQMVRYHLAMMLKAIPARRKRSGKK